MTTALDYYRREVERRRALYQRGLLWSFGPIVLALAAYCLPFASDRKLRVNALPFMTLIAVWIVSFFLIRMRIQRDLQREIDELKSLERSNS